MRRAPALLTIALFAWAVMPHAALAQSLRRPLACADCIGNWYYFDQAADATDDDWQCAGSSYDGHRGTDFSLRGGLGAIEAGHDVVAAADGMVVSATDGFYDRCTSCPAAGSDTRCGLGFGGGFGNHVVVQSGAHRLVYAHLRTGSVRVAPGDRVTCGQVLGQIGSSGCSTGAHLHFEVRSGTSSSTAYDPFAGPCSPTTPSRWVDQGPHRGLPLATCEGALSDAGVPDAGVPDAGVPDVGPSDAGLLLLDATTLDATTLDATTLDATTLDAGGVPAGIRSGCGCTTIGAHGPRGAGLPWMVLVLLAALAQSRRMSMCSMPSCEYGSEIATKPSDA